LSNCRQNLSYVYRNRNNNDTERGRREMTRGRREMMRGRGGDKVTRQQGAITSEQRLTTLLSLCLPILTTPKAGNEGHGNHFGNEHSPNHHPMLFFVFALLASVLSGPFLLLPNPPSKSTLYLRVSTFTLP